MRSVRMISMLVFLALAHASNAQSEDNLVDKLVDKLIGKFFDRASQVPQVQPLHADLDDTTLGKTGHLAMPTSRASPSSAISSATSRARSVPSFMGNGLQSQVDKAQADLSAATCKLRQMQMLQCKSRKHPSRSAVTAKASRSAVTARSAVEAPAKEATTKVRDDMRNIAIIAHVDHGKTTLVDALIETIRDHGKDNSANHIDKNDRIMDNNDQEKERGITILAKNAAISYQGTKINIVDTPGHADFGGEVERVLNMVDGVLLLVDAYEGPKPQTRFVLKKAIGLGIKVLVVINKIDKPAARPDYVLDKTFDLFCELGASDEQTDFPVVYASAINRLAGDDPEAEMKDMEPLFKKILDLPKPTADKDGPLQLQISNIASDPFIGRLGIGRLRSGQLKRGDVVGLSAGPGTEVKQAKVGELFNFDEMGRAPTDEASAGDIVTFSGIADFNIGDTIVSEDDPRPLEPMSVEQPTMSMTFGVNKSPFAGQVGKLLTGRQIRDRLDKELETNVAMRLDNTDDADKFLVSGRGLLHLTVLIETMRREGFELMVGCPQVIEKTIDGERQEPFEMVNVELPEENSGTVIQLLNERKGCMVNMGIPTSEGLVELEYEVPARGMNGVKSKLLTATKGLAVMTTTFAGYKPYAGDFGQRTNGNLLSTEAGPATAYSMGNAQSRGDLFVSPGDEVYENQIIGIHSRDNDLKMNICKTKALTNMRAAGSDDVTKIAPAKEMTLEDSVEYIGEGEYVEVTPETIRMGVDVVKKAMPKR